MLDKVFNPTECPRTSRRVWVADSLCVATSEVVVMTQQESFKRRIRERMERTGERYLVARQVLIERADSDGTRTWVGEPESSEESVRAATGKGWEQWCDLIDGWSGNSAGHTAIASYLQSEHEVDAWWAQTVTVGYERITGLRLPFQRPDGTFTASKSRLVSGDTDSLRTMLLDATHRVDLFPGLDTELRSRPQSQAIRVSIGPGVAHIALISHPDGRTKVTIAHEQLPNFDDVAEWKFYWSEWLDAIDEK